MRNMQSLSDSKRVLVVDMDPQPPNGPRPPLSPEELLKLNLQLAQDLNQEGDKESLNRLLENVPSDQVLPIMRALGRTADQ